ncbi:MAG TPA: TIM-barrel domain-containing protein [Labilithrix sp.]|nr:TIM-barrel domain-containing protein [Labilithrix sp.]
MRKRTPGVALFAAIALATGSSRAANGSLGSLTTQQCSGRSCTFATDAGDTLVLTAYGDAMVRVRAVAAGQTLHAEDRYPMVQSHALGGTLVAKDEGALVRVTSKNVTVEVTKSPLRLRFVDGAGKPLLEEDKLLGLSTGNRPLELKINGAVARAALAFPATGWKHWSSVTPTVALAAGSNVVRLTAIGASGANIDYLRVNGTTYEAENAARTGPVNSTEYPGYSGTGFLDFQNAAGDFLEWTVNVPAAGNYPLEIGYANGSPIVETFVPSAGEHFAGLGHGPYGRVDKLDLRGSVISRNRALQSSLVVPFYMSSKGYGVFLDSSYANTFSFLDGAYSLALASGQMDYFFIAGPTFGEVLERYTLLTGRPRLPPLAAFGLGLSDKIGDALPSDEAFWKETVGRMRKEGYTFDTIVHDNAWRGGKTAPWRWDTTRFPDPKEFATWSKQNGVVNQLDFNRADAPLSAGWLPGLALPGTTDWPDFSGTAARMWFWQLLKSESFDPALGYPGDFVWLDEFDEDVTPTGTLANGWDWDENANLYFFQMAQAVGEGWDATFAGAKRPYIMARGMTAGAQRWSSLWSGDIQNTYGEMKTQIRGMLASGLSGFPYWTHDAGGFFDKPSDAMYRQWSLAMGSFSPTWKPHGPPLRFPWLFGQAAQDDMHAYGKLRMELMPYLYTYAALAETTGAPIARAMFFDYQAEPDAWTHDLQYLWGRELLVAPTTDDGGGTVSVWLPPGDWYAFDDPGKPREHGPKTLEVPAPTGKLALFVKAGAIVPRAIASLGTASWDRERRVVDVHVGAAGRFTLHEDDGLSEAHLKGGRALTPMVYEELGGLQLTLGPEDGTYANVPAARRYEVRFHGLAAPLPLAVNGVTLPPSSVAWSDEKKTLTATLPSFSRETKIVIKGPEAPLDGGTPGGDGGTPGAAPGDAAADGGCGCHASPATGTGAALVVTAAALAFARLRRRRRGPQAS